MARSVSADGVSTGPLGARPMWWAGVTRCIVPSGAHSAKPYLRPPGAVRRVLRAGNYTASHDRGTSDIVARSPVGAARRALCATARIPRLRARGYGEVEVS